MDCLPLYSNRQQKRHPENPRSAAPGLTYCTSSNDKYSERRHHNEVFGKLISENTKSAEFSFSLWKVRCEGAEVYGGGAM
jgi:hypothetical protein